MMKSVGLRRTWKSAERFVTFWGHLYLTTILHVLGHLVLVLVVLTLHHSQHLMIVRSEMYMKFPVWAIFFDHFGYPSEIRSKAHLTTFY